MCVFVLMICGVIAMKVGIIDDGIMISMILILIILIIFMTKR